MRHIWIILVLLTLFAFLVGWLKLVNSLFVSILLVTTFIKGQLVSEYFMGLKNVTIKYRMIPTIWLFIVLTSIAIAYYSPISN
jgi:hypothetical protein